jgi:hypothetical protein
VKKSDHGGGTVGSRRGLSEAAYNGGKAASVGGGVADPAGKALPFLRCRSTLNSARTNRLRSSIQNIERARALSMPTQATAAITPQATEKRMIFCRRSRAS